MHWRGQDFFPFWNEVVGNLPVPFFIRNLKVTVLFFILMEQGKSLRNIALLKSLEYCSVCEYITTGTGDTVMKQNPKHINKATTKWSTKQHTFLIRILALSLCDVFSTWMNTVFSFRQSCGDLNKYLFCNTAYAFWFTCSRGLRNKSLNQGKDERAIPSWETFICFYSAMSSIIFHLAYKSFL